MPTSTKRPARRPRPVAKARSRPRVTIEDLEAFNESINILVYGDSGVGKTPFVGAAPNACFLSTEKGAISAKRFGSTAKLMRATSWERIEVAIEMMEADPSQFDWLIVDSLTKMQQLLLRFLLETNVEEKRNKADIDVPQVQDHQKWQNMFKRFVDRLIDLDMNVIFVATAMHREDEEGDDLVLPHIQGKDYEICQYVLAQMDTILCLRVMDEPDEDGQPVWKVLSKARPPYFAKDRYNALPTVMIDPSMDDVIDRIVNSAVDEDGNPAVEARRARRLAGVEEDPDGEEPEDDVDEEDEGDETPPPKRRRKPSATTRGRKPAAKSRDDEGDVDDYGDDDDIDADEDEEDEPPPPRRKKTARKGVRKPPVRRKRPDPEEDEDDDFDPDDGDEVEFDDDED